MANKFKTGVGDFSDLLCVKPSKTSDTQTLRAYLTRRGVREQRVESGYVPKTFYYDLLAWGSLLNPVHYRIGVEREVSVENDKVDDPINDFSNIVADVGDPLLEPDQPKFGSLVDGYWSISDSSGSSTYYMAGRESTLTYPPNQFPDPHVKDTGRYTGDTVDHRHIKAICLIRNPSESVATLEMIQALWETSGTRSVIEEGHFYTLKFMSRVETTDATQDTYFDVYFSPDSTSRQFLGRAGNQRWDLDSESWVRDLEDGWKIHTFTFYVEESSLANAAYIILDGQFYDRIWLGNFELFENGTIDFEWDPADDEEVNETSSTGISAPKGGITGGAISVNRNAIGSYLATLTDGSPVFQTADVTDEVGDNTTETTTIAGTISGSVSYQALNLDLYFAENFGVVRSGNAIGLSDGSTSGYFWLRKVPLSLAQNYGLISCHPGLQFNRPSGDTGDLTEINAEVYSTWQHETETQRGMIAYFHQYNESDGRDDNNFVQWSGGTWSTFYPRWMCVHRFVNGYDDPNRWVDLKFTIDANGYSGTDLDELQVSGITMVSLPYASASMSDDLDRVYAKYVQRVNPDIELPYSGWSAWKTYHHLCLKLWTDGTNYKVRVAGDPDPSYDEDTTYSTECESATYLGNVIQVDIPYADRVTLASDIAAPVNWPTPWRAGEYIPYKSRVANYVKLTQQLKDAIDDLEFYIAPALYMKNSSDVDQTIIDDGDNRRLDYVAAIDGVGGESWPTSQSLAPTYNNVWFARTLEQEVGPNSGFVVYDDTAYPIIEGPHSSNDYKIVIRSDYQADTLDTYGTDVTIFASWPTQSFKQTSVLGPNVNASYTTYDPLIDDLITASTFDWYAQRIFSLSDSVYSMILRSRWTSSTVEHYYTFTIYDERTIGNILLDEGYVGNELVLTHSSCPFYFDDDSGTYTLISDEFRVFDDSDYVRTWIEQDRDDDGLVTTDSRLLSKKDTDKERLWYPEVNAGGYWIDDQESWFYATPIHEQIDSVREITLTALPRHNSPINVRGPRQTVTTTAFSVDYWTDAISLAAYNDKIYVGRDAPVAGTDYPVHVYDLDFREQKIIKVAYQPLKLAASKDGLFYVDSNNVIHFHGFDDRTFVVWESDLPVYGLDYEDDRLWLLVLDGSDWRIQSIRDSGVLDASLGWTFELMTTETFDLSGNLFGLAIDHEIRTVLGNGSITDLYKEKILGGRQSRGFSSADEQTAILDLTHLDNKTYALYSTGDASEIDVLETVVPHKHWRQVGKLDNVEYFNQSMTVRLAYKNVNISRVVPEEIPWSYDGEQLTFSIDPATVLSPNELVEVHYVPADSFVLRYEKNSDWQAVLTFDQTIPKAVVSYETSSTNKKVLPIPLNPLWAGRNQGIIYATSQQGSPDSIASVCSRSDLGSSDIVYVSAWVLDQNGNPVPDVPVRYTFYSLRPGDTTIVNQLIPTKVNNDYVVSTDGFEFSFRLSRSVTDILGKATLVLTGGAITNTDKHLVIKIESLNNVRSYRLILNQACSSKISAETLREAIE